MHLNDISSEVSLGIVKMINTAKSRVGLDSPFIIAVLGIDFVGQFTVYNEREYITLQSTVTKEIYHDLRWEAGNINRVIEWIRTEAYYSRMSGE
jgi:hypothetical protein